ncbi:hypothetical protein ABH966_005321, partial [Lysinibacillus sp. RC46]|uniref:hypothetical protein n=1 Tax=Lysinibacillus sp. RC46 TaxID=3156295 RepID=UPI003515A773
MTVGKMLMLFGTLIVGRMTAVEVLERVRGREKATYIKWREAGTKPISKLKSRRNFTISKISPAFNFFHK